MICPRSHRQEVAEVGVEALSDIRIGVQSVGDGVRALEFHPYSDSH